MEPENTLLSGEHARKKSSLLGWLSFLALALGIGVLGTMAIFVWRIYTNASAANIGILLNLLGIAVILFAVALVMSVVTLFLRKQKKGLAIVTIILSILFLLLAGGARYMYHSVFESTSYDEEFNEIPEEKLYINPDWLNNEIKFEEFPHETLHPEEVEEQIKQYEIDWPLLDEADVPDHVYPYMYSQDQESPCYLLPGAEQIDNFVLYGIDDNGLSDVIMVVSMDRAHKKIKLISIQRDSYVRVPGWGGYTKINHAYGYGKEESALATLNMNFKLNIKDYFTLHFYQVAAIIDVLGGVDVYLDSDEARYLRNSGFPECQEGPAHLGGSAAVIYSRIRQSSANDNEVRRTGRQREVLNSLFYSAKSAPISNYPALVETFTSLCKTSVEGERLLSMMIEAVTGGYTIENYALINEVESWGGQFGPGNMWYFVYDLDAAGDKLYRMIYEDLYVSGYPGNEEATEAESE